LLVPSRLRDAFWTGFRQAVNDGSIANRDELLRMRAVRKGGSRLYVDLSFGLVRDGFDSVIGAFAIARECTARHLAEKRWSLN
jgi:hypothetical protein